ncbi:hypothetical protein F5Y14DRAFT_255399 [Nemania sp. NC0429]|nr:hypothetical protein F5Y14DRAFT_255399 [Nemania sp. NC0429]
MDFDFCYFHGVLLASCLFVFSRWFLSLYLSLPPLFFLLPLCLLFSHIIYGSSCTFVPIDRQTLLHRIWFAGWARPEIHIIISVIIHTSVITGQGMNEREKEKKPGSSRAVFLSSFFFFDLTDGTIT